MGNLNNVDQDGTVNPKPGDDPGANIETVIPEPKNERLPNDKNDAPGNTEDTSATDSGDKERTAPKAPENNGGSGYPEIETVTPDE